MQRPSLLDNFVDCGPDPGFLRHIGFEGKELVWEAPGKGVKGAASVIDVNGVDYGCAVVEPTFRDSETNSSICISDCRAIIYIHKVYILRMRFLYMFQDPVYLGVY